MTGTTESSSSTVSSGAGVALEPPPQASDVGTLLCATRMRLGKDLQAVAGVLHIRYNFLVAIEDGRYEDLPGQAYAIGFVRAYADHLGLDGDEVVRRYKDETAGIERKTRYEYPIPAPESGIPSGALLLVAAVLGMMVYGVWYTMADADRRAADVIQEVPERLAALLEGNSAAPAPDNAKAEASADTDEMQAATAVVAAEDDSEDSSVASANPVAPSGETPPSQVAAVSPTVADEVPETKSPEPTLTTVEAAKPQPPAPSPSKALPDAGGTQPPAAPTATARLPPIATTAPVAQTSPEAPSSLAEPKAVTSRSATGLSPTATPRKPDDAPKAVRPAAAPGPVATPAASGTASPSPASPVTAAANRPPEQAASAGKEAVELRAKSDSWIQIRDGEQLLLTRFLRKGETYRVPDRPGLTLMTLNAGGIDVLVNGEAMPPLGEPGGVARGVVLDAQKLRSAAKPPASN